MVSAVWRHLLVHDQNRSSLVVPGDTTIEHSFYYDDEVINPPMT